MYTYIYIQMCTCIYIHINIHIQIHIHQVWVQVDAHSGKLTEQLPGAQGSVPVMLATDFRRDKYHAYLLALLTDKPAAAAAPLAPDLMCVCV